MRIEEQNDNAVRAKYEAEYDLLSVWLGQPQPADQIEVEPGIYVRIARSNHQVVGLEVIEAGSRLHQDADTLSSTAFARQLIQKYASAARSSFTRVALSAR